MLMAVDNSDKEYFKKLELDVFAKTLWGESRDEPVVVKEAVASVIMNRVRISEKRGRYWWGNSIIEVCQKPYQFDCWNRSSQSYLKMQTVDLDNNKFYCCVDIAIDAIDRVLSDNTKGSTHYHHKSIEPYWSRGEKPKAVIGAYKFYKLVEA